MWHMGGGVCGRGCAWLGGVRGRGVCMAGGHAWQGACMAGGVGAMHGRGCVTGEHVWQWGVHATADTMGYGQ